MKTCENCENEITVIYGSGRFCSSKCARGFSTKSKRKEINECVRKKLKKDLVIVEIICKECQSIFCKQWGQHKRIFCSRACSITHTQKSKNISSLGGKNSATQRKKYQYTKQGREDGLSRKIHGLEIGCSNQPPASTFIYTLSDGSDIKYVGKADDPFGRLKNHLKECTRRRTKKERWIYTLKQEGRKPTIEILEEVCFSEWQQSEIYWITQLKSWGFHLLNGTDGGEGSNGFKGKHHSFETKEKLKLLSTGKRFVSKLKGENGTNVKLSKLQVDEIRLKLQYMRAADIAREYKVSKCCVHKIKYGHTWK